MLQISVENTGQLQRRMTVVVPPQRIESEMQKRLQKLTQTARIEGFRPGKVPMSVIKQRFGEAVLEEVKEAMLRIAMNEALTQEKLTPATIPVIQSMEVEKDNSLHFVATFEVFPDVDLKDLSDVQLEKEIIAVAESDIDNVIEQIRNQHCNWKVVQRSARQGDQVTLDLQWTGNENPPQAHEQKNIAWVLEAGALPVDISILEGVKAGDDVTINIPLQTPDKAQLAATAKIISVAERELPDLNDAFAKKMDVSDMAALREQVREHMLQQTEETTKNKLKSKVLEKLLERHHVDLPRGLIDEEIKQLENEVRAKYAKGMSKEVIAQALKGQHAQIEQAAKRRVTLGVIFNALVKKYNLVIDNKKVQNRMRYFAAMFQDAKYGSQMVANDQKLMSAIQSQVLEDQIVEKLLEQTSFTEKKIPYADFLKQESPEIQAEKTGKSHPSDRPVVVK